MMCLMALHTLCAFFSHREFLDIFFCFFLGFFFFFLFLLCFFFFNDTATTEIYTLSLHDALPIFFRFLFSAFVFRFSFFVFSFQFSFFVFRFSFSETFAETHQIGRAHVWTPVTATSRMPSSAWKKKKNKTLTINKWY